MFHLRARIIDFYLACFDLALSGVCYFALLRSAIEGKGAQPAWRTLFTAEHLLAMGWTLGIWLALLVYFAMYRSRRMQSPFWDVWILAKVGATSLLVLESLAILAPALDPARHFLLRFVVISFLALGLSRSGIRFALHEFRRRGHNTKTLLLVASPQLGDRLVQKILRRAHYGYRIHRCLICDRDAGESGEQIKLEFQACLCSAAIDDVILALPVEARHLAAHLVAECETHGKNVSIVPDLFPLVQRDTQVYDLDGIPLVNVHLYPTEYFGYVILKRIFDAAVSFCVLLLLSPLFLLIALLLRLTSPGPVFFIQERVGLNGRTFRMLKFRTMRQESARDPHSHWTTRNDPNVTPLGRWLRRSNLDELPQFLNVLWGDMSLVGPRPERSYFIERFRKEVPEYMLRHYVKSGITGWAQVNGWRGDTSIQERVKHDLYYMRNWALSLDIKILLLTLTRTFFHRNAY